VNKLPYICSIPALVKRHAFNAKVNATFPRKAITGNQWLLVSLRGVVVLQVGGHNNFDGHREVLYMALAASVRCIAVKDDNVVYLLPTISSMYGSKACSLYGTGFNTAKPLARGFCAT
jgi:hypothetical protein